MTLVADISSISTSDAAPTSAPYKISRISTKDQATVTYSLTEAAAIIVYGQLRLGGSSRTSFGTRLQHLGAVCGLGNRCGYTGTRPLAKASPYTAADIVIDDAIVTGADGDYTVTAEGLTAAGDWSA